MSLCTDFLRAGIGYARLSAKYNDTDAAENTVLKAQASGEQQCGLSCVQTPHRKITSVHDE
jgi:hypothetical protein